MEMLSEYPAANRLWINPVTFSTWTRENPLNFRSDEQNLKKNPSCSCLGVFFVQLKTSCVGGGKELREREEDAKCPSHGFHFGKISNKAEVKQQ